MLRTILLNSWLCVYFHASATFLSLSLQRDGQVPPSVVEEYMHDNMSDEERFRVKWAALSLYLAGSDTVSAYPL